MIGNTLQDGKWAEFYHSGGWLGGKNRHNRRTYKGKWKIEGSRICLDYPDSSYDGCVAISVSGNQVTWYGEDGSVRWTAERVLGNPYNQ